MNADSSAYTVMILARNGVSPRRELLEGKLLTLCKARGLTLLFGSDA
jgi:hypothetical protein